MTAKAQNYTDVQTAAIVDAAMKAGGKITSDMAVALAETLGKSVRSLTAKASRMGIYQAKEYKTMTGEAVIHKDSLADKLAEIVGLTKAEASSLAKANKTALNKILVKLEG